MIHYWVGDTTLEGYFPFIVVYTKIVIVVLVAKEAVSSYKKQRKVWDKDLSDMLQQLIIEGIQTFGKTIEIYCQTLPSSSILSWKQTQGIQTFCKSIEVYPQILSPSSELVTKTLKSDPWIPVNRSWYNFNSWLYTSSLSQLQNLWRDSNNTKANPKEILRDTANLSNLEEQRE